MWTSRTTFIAVSLVVHGALAYGVGELEVKKAHAATAIQIANVKKPPAKKPPEAKVEPPPRKPEPPTRERRAAAPKPAETPPPPAETPSPAPENRNFPDFGVSLSGGVDGTGIALPVGGSTRSAARSATPAPVAPKRLQGVAATAPGLDPCEEPAAKPKPRNVPQPAGTEAARAASAASSSP
jgi:hypothetical protein